MSAGSISKATVFRDVNGDIKKLQFNAEAPQVCAQTYLEALAEGDITGHSQITRYGIVSAVQDATLDVSTGVTNPYVFPSNSGEQMRVVSSSANDASGQTGVQKIKIDYLDENLVEQTEEVTMNGTNPVNTTATKIRRVNRVYASVVGTGGVAAGNITVYHFTNPTPIYGYVGAGYTLSRQMIYTVPAGKTLYIYSINLSAGAGSTSAAKFNFCTFTTRITMDPPGVLSSIFYPFSEVGILNSSFHLELKSPTKVVSGADFKIVVKGDVAVSVVCTAAIRAWLE